MAELERRTEDRMTPGPQDQDLMEALDRRVDRLFGRGVMSLWWRGPAFGEMLSGRRPPRVDVRERDDDVAVRAEVPGVDKGDLGVAVSADNVSIRGRARHEDEQEGSGYYRREIGATELASTIPLPAEVDGDNTRARFRNGILELTLPRTSAQRRRRITIEG